MQKEWSAISSIFKNKSYPPLHGLEKYGEDSGWSLWVTNESIAFAKIIIMKNVKRDCNFPW